MRWWCWCFWCADASNAADVLMCWCTVAAGALLLLMRCCCWCGVTACALMCQFCWCCWCADATESLSGSACWPFCSNFLQLMVLFLFGGWQKFERLICGSADVVSGRHIVRMTFGQDGLPPLDICQDYAFQDKLSSDPRLYIPVFFRIIFLQIYLL